MPGSVSGVLKAVDVTLERHSTHISANPNVITRVLPTTDGQKSLQVQGKHNYKRGKFRDFATICKCAVSVPVCLPSREKHL